MCLTLGQTELETHSQVSTEPFLLVSLIVVGQTAGMG